MVQGAPLIPQQAGSGARPFWSVMIPTYNPRANYLEETLRSVLKRDPGPEQMQIELVDDCSMDETASEITLRVGAFVLWLRMIASRLKRKVKSKFSLPINS